MRGSIRQRSPGSWRLTLEFGYVQDPVTGKAKRVQKYVTVRGSKRDAERRLNDLIGDVQDGTFIQPDKRTVGQWLDEWVELALKPPRRTQRAYDTYKSVIARHLKPSLGHLRLQGLRSIDVEAFVTAKADLAPATVEKVFTVLSSALKAAVRNQLLARNVATLVSNRPHAPQGHPEAVSNCWSAQEAAQFLRVAKAAGPQPAAMWTLALDTGIRKSELAGLRWADLDLPRGQLLVSRQLLAGGASPTFTPTKGKRARAIDLASETLDLLKAHKAHQATVKMRFRRRYRDLGLMFAKEWSEGGRRHEVLGLPIAVNNIGERQFASLIQQAGVRRISVHGLRHTCASLLLSSGVSPNVVRDRLGHRSVETTLTVYAHCLPGQQQDASRRLAALLHGAKS
jgi:integrase